MWFPRHEAAMLARVHWTTQPRSLPRHLYARAGPDGNEESHSRVPSLTAASLSLHRVPLCWSLVCRALRR